MKLIETVRVDRLLTLSTNIHVIFVYLITNMELIIHLKAYYYGSYNYRLASNIISSIYIIGSTTMPMCWLGMEVGYFAAVMVTIIYDRFEV